ncbi:hypothetical protein Tco_1398321 [Tanacetum coccineum]
MTCNKRSNGCKLSWEISRVNVRVPHSVSDTIDPLSQKLENVNVELEFQVQNYEKENEYLKKTYKNLFDSIKVARAQTKSIIDSLQDKLHETIYENVKLRAQLFDKVSERKDTTKGTSVNTQFCKRLILGKPPSSSRSKFYYVTPFPKSKGLPKIDESHALSKLVTSNSTPSSRESNVMNNERVIAPGIFKINPFKASGVDNFLPNKHVKASIRTKPITISQPRVITKNDLVVRNKKSEVVCATCKQCLITTNHDECVLQYVNSMKSRQKNQHENVSKSANQKKHKANVKKSKKLGSEDRLASSRPSKPRTCLKWLPTGRIFDLSETITKSSNSESEFDTFVFDTASASNPQEPSI